MSLLLGTISLPGAMASGADWKNSLANSKGGNAPVAINYLPKMVYDTV